ncbi:hypothetical protein Tco_0198145, partial [Tanacetum coccineum]
LEYAVYAVFRLRSDLYVSSFVSETPKARRSSILRFVKLALNKKKQHVFDVLKAKSIVIAFFECVQLVVISTNNDPFQMFVIVFLE